MQLKLSGVYYWRGKLGGVLQVPRQAHAQQDAAEAALFQQQLADQLKRLNLKRAVEGVKPQINTDGHR